MKAFILSFLVFVPLVQGSPLHYVEVIRTIKKMSAVSLDGCKKNYRFLNGNWMDCDIELPRHVASRLAQLSPAFYPEVTERFPVKGTDKTLYINVAPASVGTYQEGSTTSGFHVIAYYQSPDRPAYIHSMDEEMYSFEILKKTLRQVFLKTDRNGIFTSKPMIVLDAPASPIYKDKIRNVVKVGVKTTLIDLQGCFDSYSMVLADGWPNDDYWYSSCYYHTGPQQDSHILFMDGLFSAHLQAIHKLSSVIIPVTPALKVHFYADTGMFKATFGNISDADSMQFSAAVPLDEARNLLAQAVVKVPNMKTLFIVKGTYLPGQGEESLGCLVARASAQGDVLDTDPACQ